MKYTAERTSLEADELLQINVPECERPYAFWLVSVPWIGQGAVPALLKAFGSPEEIYKRSDDELRYGKSRKNGIEALLEYRRTHDIFSEYERFLKSGMKLTFVWDMDYPGRLLHIPDPPIALFYYGNLPEKDRLSVAVIGARMCSGYGAKLAGELGSELGKNGVNVISGMAAGIDGISQMAALSSGGASYGVLGSGADICYPESNRTLYERLKENGGIISSYPPGTKAIAGFFPPRNRIVSGLADAVVVLEARARSGTLITVNMALEQGRDIYAAPGRLGDELSAGCNGLIGHGASVYLSPEIFMRDLFEDHADRLSSGKPAIAFEKNYIRTNFDSACDKRHRGYDCEKEREPALDESHLNVYRQLSLYPQSAEEIDEKLRQQKILSPGETGICLILMELCLDDLAIQVSSGQFCRK